MSESPFKRYVRSTCIDGPVYIEPLAGNNGDRLIRMGLEHILNELSIPVATAPQQAARIIVTGGGAMNEAWGGLDVLASYVDRFSRTPLTVAPSSFQAQAPRLTSIGGAHQADLILFAREPTSAALLRHMELPPNVVIQQSQDLAFELANTRFIRELRRDASDSHVLVAFRKDLEGPASVLRRVRAPWLPSPVRRPLSLLRDRAVARRGQYLVDKAVAARGLTQLPILYRDVSSSVPFEEFASLIARSAYTITNRLHVAILGHLLGKEQLLVAGHHHKVKGVYEYSMSGERSRTTLVDSLNDYR